MKRIWDASIVANVLVDEVAAEIVSHSLDVVEIEPYVYTNTSQPTGKDVVQIDKATGEVIKTFEGNIMWLTDVVSFEARTPNENEPSFYITLRDMRMHTTLRFPLLFINYGGEDLLVTRGGLIGHGHEPKLSAPLCANARLAKNVQFIQCYDGKTVVLGKYSGWADLNIYKTKTIHLFEK